MKTTKKASSRNSSTDESDDLLPHYDFDYSKAKPNRFAAMKREQTFVLLDKELSKVFKTGEEVNKALHSLIDAIPVRNGKKAGASGLAKRS